MPYNMPGTIAIIILVVLVLVVVVSCINIVQQSKAYVVERLGAFHSVWERWPALQAAVHRAGGEEGQPQGAGGRLRSPARHHQG